MESAPVPNFDTMAAVQPSLTPETINGQTATFESVGGSSGATSSGLISSNANTNTSGGNIHFANTDSGNIEGASSDGGMATFESVANTDQASTTALGGYPDETVANSDFANNMNNIVDLLMFALNPQATVGIGAGEMLMEHLGIGAFGGFGPDIEFQTDKFGNNSLNAGINLSGFAGLVVPNTPLQFGYGQTFASGGVNIGSDGVSIYTSGLEGSSTSGDSSSNMGTAIDYSDNNQSTAGELAATDGETTFGNSATNEGGPAHINPSEYASLQAAGYTPPILSSNFGNFDDIQYVNPNAPV